MHQSQPPPSTKESNDTKVTNKNKRVPNDVLRRERKRLNLTQEKLAEKIGTSAVNVSRWECGKTIPSLHYRKKLSEYFSLSSEVLFPILLDEPKQEEEQPVSLPQPVPSASSDKPINVQVNPTQQEVRQPDEIPYASTFHFNIRLTDYREFYGRKYEWNTLQNRLLKQSSTSIVGPRRIGKTWLMTYLKLVAPEKLGPHIRIGHLDATMPTCNTLSGFIAEIFKELEILPSPSPPIPLDMIMLETAIRNMIAQNETPVLCIDEFEALCRCPDFHLNFLENLRALTQIGLALVIASKRPLIDIVEEVAGKQSKTSPFFNVFEQITLKPFIEREAQQFVHEKGSQARFTEQEQALMLHYGQVGQSQWPPLRLQLVGDLLERDKMLALDGDPERYQPEEPSYWSEFEQRLEEKYRGVVS
jgi:transcriptional regulator with XRE-family HTH domain